MKISKQNFEEIKSLVNCRYGFCKACENRFWEIIKEELKEKGSGE